MTVDEALLRAAARLRAAGVREPALDAESLLRHVLGWSRADLVAHGRDALAGDARAAYDALLARRADRVPLQHLTGLQAFWRHEFEVSPDVLVPRPETEGVVEAALELLAPLRAPRVVDVGAGSGCIGLSIAAERGEARVTAVDLSAGALRVASRNAVRLGLARRVGLVRGDLLACVRDQAVDLVASNPPYVEEADWAALEPEVRDHEPRLALVPPGGARALYGRLLAGAARVLVPGGHAVLEIGLGQQDALRAVGEAAGLRFVRCVTDLQGIPRVLAFMRP